MSTHLNQYVAACRLEDDLRAAAAARAVPRRNRRKSSPAGSHRFPRIPRLAGRRGMAR
jgi:hypothetical protein